MPAIPSHKVGPPGFLRRHWAAPAAVRALLAQLGAAVVAVAYAAASTREDGVWLHPILLHAVLAAALGHALKLPLWWLPINALFVPLALWAQRLMVHPIWFLAAFALLLGMFWTTTYRTRAPLSLSHSSTCERVAALLPATSQSRLLDLGCGFGGVLLALHRFRPGVRLAGREIAPVPAWIARLRLKQVPFADVRRADFWHEDLSKYDLVYAFLSPEPMSDLWSKVRREMRPGTLFVSNEFSVREVSPDLVLPLAGSDGAPLYVWRL